MMEMCGVSNAPLVAHMIRRAKFDTTKFSQAYRMDNNSSHLIVGNSVTHPLQFALGANPTEATFTDKCGGIGWNSTNVADFFQMSSLDEDNGEKRKEQKMISSKQFEAYHAMLWTMRCIKVTRVKIATRIFFMFNVTQKPINMVMLVLEHYIQQCLRRTHSVLLQLMS